jgi:beta-galactosidase/beta-glucuronidase
VAQGRNGEKLIIENIHLWNGLSDPYLYTATAELYVDDKCVDRVQSRCGFRVFRFDPQKGFFLNGKSYPLRGVSRHQDRPKIGNALTRENHEEDMRLIREIGANTVRLAHYQQDDYFYDLCDENGLVVWAEIPYISRHMPEANPNAVQQMKELIFQQYNHPSIVMWGVSNEITMYGKHRKDMLAFHQKLNSLVKELDPTRVTTLACFAMCGPFNKVAHITDVVAWNLYLGWYVPGFFLNDLWLKFYHMCYPNSSLGFSEYGAEAMPNLHSRHPKRGDNSEEYQANYHEYMLRCFARHPFLWGTYVWNMFDFAADARNQGGEPGMNHKGLVTFDRQTKKDSFYAYKAYWSSEPFVHIVGKRYANRTEKTTVVKVYTNTNGVKLYNNGVEIAGKTKDKKVFEFKVKLEKENKIKAVSGELTDECVLHKVEKPDPDYVLHVKSETQSWQK